MLFLSNVSIAPEINVYAKASVPHGTTKDSSGVVKWRYSV